MTRSPCTALLLSGTNVADGKILYEETHKGTLEAANVLPTFIRDHGIDLRPSHELAAAWVTPGASPIKELIATASTHVASGGAVGLSFPQVQATCDELRSRHARFVRDPSTDSEGTHRHVVGLPADVLAGSNGNALEGTILVASLLEGLGLDPILVNLPGHALVGWVPTAADRASDDAMKTAVPSPVGNAFFLETTVLFEAPADAAVLRGDAEFVEAVASGAFDNGSATALLLSTLRKAGIVPTDG